MMICSIMGGFRVPHHGRSKLFISILIHLQRLLSEAEIIADRSYYKFGGKQTEGSLAVSLSFRKGVEFRRQVANFRPDQYDINLKF